MNDGSAGPGSRGRVVVGVAGTPNSLAALCRAAYQARNRGASLNVVYVIPAGANATAEASGCEMLGIAAGSRSAAAHPVAARPPAVKRVLRETGSDAR